MLKNVSNKTLGLLFAGLLIFAVIIVLFDSGGNERSFRTELVDIDTSAVSQILIYPKKLNGESVKLFQEGSNWRVELADGKTAPVLQSKIDELIKQLTDVKPGRLAGRGKENWSQFEVDSSATRVEVYEGSDKTLDLLIGKFAFQQPRTMKTYVRLTEDTDVYEIDGFLSMTFNQDANAYRDPTIISGKETEWNSLAFSYPADSSYQLVKMNDRWQLSNGSPVDSAKTATALRQMINLRGSDFVDLDKETLPMPEYKLTIVKSDDSQIEVFGYKTADDMIIINSSQNPEAYFDGSEGNLFNRVFVGRKKFLNY